MDLLSSTPAALRERDPLRWLPLLAASSVLVVSVGVAVVASGGSEHSPRPLHLVSGTGAEAARAADSAGATALGAPAYGGGYELRGTLPSSPTTAAAHQLRSEVNQASVRRLADALGLGSGPVHHAGRSWSVSLRDVGSLQVDEATGQWGFSEQYCGDAADGSEVGCVGTGVASRPVSSSGSGSGSGSSGSGSGSGSSGSGSGSSGSGSTANPAPVWGVCAPTSKSCPEPAVTAPPSPSEAAARAAATPVLEATGWGRAAVTTTDLLGARSVTAQTTVDGTPVVGWQTDLTVGSDGHVSYASGWLSTPHHLDDYPLVTAQAAFDRLPSGPQPMLLRACPPNASCPAPAPTVVTGASLGLQLSWSTDRSVLLVPAWLLEVTGSQEPLAVLAVEPRYLGEDEPADQPTDVPPGKPEPATGAPGQVEPAPPASEQPPGATKPTADPGQGSSDGRQSYPVQGYEATSSGLRVQWYESGSCPVEDPRIEVKEDDSAVYVLLTGTAPAPDRACTADARPASRTVELAAQLGKRRVVDASSGRELEATP